MSVDTARRTRRIVVADDADGRSVVVADGVPEAVGEKPGTSVVSELWRQETLPARPSDDGVRAALDPALPPAGAVVRRYTLLPGHEVDPLHRSECLHVITVVSGRVELLLDSGETGLEPGDTLVLPGATHTLHNRGAVPAEMVYVGFPLQR